MSGSDSLNLFDYVMNRPLEMFLQSLALFAITYILFSPKTLDKVLKGRGVPVGFYLLLLFTSCYFIPRENVTIYLVIIVPVHLWAVPLQELADFMFQVSKFIEILGRIRSQMPNLAPYMLDLLPYAPGMIEKMDVVVANIEVMGEAMPIMMKEKEYILPVMDQIIDKLEIIAPTIPSMLPIIHKIAPKIDKLLPKIEIMAPYIDDLVPLWDDLEPHLDTMLLEMDNLEPLLPKLVKDMDRMIPVLNLMPIIHETGVLNVNIIKNSVPFMTKLLPKSQDIIARSVVSHASRALEKVAITSKTFLSK